MTIMKNYSLSVFSLLVLLCFAIPCNAAWKFTPFITLEGIYTDNIELEDRGEEDEYILALDPGFNLHGEGGRFEVDIDYAMRNLFYLEESDRNNTDHELNAFAEGEILSNLFFVDLGSTISQQIVDPDARTSNNRVSRTGNSTDVITAFISPYLTRDIWRDINFLARYRYGFVDFNDRRTSGRQEDADSHFYIVELKDQSDTKKINWRLNYQTEQIQFEDSNIEDEFEAYSAELGYRLTPYFTLLGEYGYEDDTFGADNSNVIDGRENTIRIDRDFWKAGFRWQINTFNTIAFKYGDRDFGNTREASWRRIGPKLEIDVVYDEDITDQVRQLLRNASEGVPSVSFARNRGLGLNANAFVKEELDAKISYKLSRSVYTFSAFQVERDFRETTEPDEEIYGFGLEWAWRFSGKSTSTLSFDWDQRDEDNTPNNVGGDDERYLVEARIDTQFTPRTLGFAAYEHEDRDAENSDNDFEENIVRVGVTITF